MEKVVERDIASECMKSLKRIFGEDYLLYNFNSKGKVYSIITEEVIGEFFVNERGTVSYKEV